jgi:hypothetical protein
LPQPSDATKRRQVCVYGRGVPTPEKYPPNLYPHTKAEDNYNVWYYYLDTVGGSFNGKTSAMGQLWYVSGGAWT